MSMSSSALWGDPPANANDKLIFVGIIGAKYRSQYEIPPKVQLPPGSPESQATQSVIGTSFAIGFVVLITGGRLAVRSLFRGQNFGADDVVIIPAALLVIAYHAVNLSAISYAGAGKHVNYITYAQFQLFHELGVIAQVLFFAAVSLVKISMVLFNRRVTGLSSRGWRLFHNIFLGILVVWFFISLFINIFPCSPTITYYTYSSRAGNPDYKCFNEVDVAIAFSAIHAFTDFILFCVPIYIILRVQMPLGRKFRLAMLFGLGAVCVTASIVRTTIAQDDGSADYTWSAVQDVSWTIVDITFSAVVASLPALNAVIEKVSTKTMSSRMWASWREFGTALKSPFGSGKAQGSDAGESNELSDGSIGQSGNRKQDKGYGEPV